MDFFEQLSEFSAETVRANANFTEAMLVERWRNHIYQEDFSSDYLISKLDTPIGTLKKNVDILYKMKDEINSAFEFYNNYPKINFGKTNTTIEWYETDELLGISFAYIDKKCAESFQRRIQDIISGKSTFKEVYEYYGTPNTEDTIMTSFYGTSFNHNMALSRLAKITNTTTLYISKDTTRTKVLPFLVDLLDQKLTDKQGDSGYNYKKMGFNSTLKKIESGFDHLYTDIADISDAAKEALHASGANISAGDIDRLAQTFISIVYRAHTRLLILLMRNVTAYTANIKALLKIKSLLSVQDGTSIRNIYEEYEEDDIGNPLNLSMTNLGGVIGTAKDIQTMLVNTKNVDLGEVPETVRKYSEKNPVLKAQIGRDTVLDRGLYDYTDAIMLQIKALIDRILANMIAVKESDEQVPFDVILRESGTDWNYTGINWNCPAGAGKMLNPTPKYILADIYQLKASGINAGDSVTQIAEKIQEIIAAVTNNVNGQFDAIVDIKAPIDWMKGLADRVAKLNCDLGVSYRDRVVSLANVAPMPIYGTVHVKEEPREYYSIPVNPADDHLSNDADYLTHYEEEAADERLQNVHMYWAKVNRDEALKRMRAERPSMFYEDENQNQQQTNNGGQQQNNQQGGNNQNQQGNNQQNNGQQNTQQESSDNNQNNQNNNNNNQNQNQNGGDQNKSNKSFLEKIKEKIKKIIEHITDQVNKGVYSSHVKWLNSNSNMPNENYVNRSIPLYPYRETIMQTTWLANIISQAASFDESFLKTATEDQINERILSKCSMPSKKNNESLKEWIERGFKFGKVENPEEKPVADNELKEKVGQMFAFCHWYYGKAHSTALNNANTEVDKQLKKYDTMKGQGGEGDNTNSNISAIATCVTTAITAYRSVARAIAEDYFAKLQSLSNSKNGTKNASQNPQNNGTQSSEGQSNNQENNTGAGN